MLRLSQVQKEGYVCLCNLMHVVVKFVMFKFLLDTAKSKKKGMFFYILMHNVIIYNLYNLPYPNAGRFTLGF